MRLTVLFLIALGVTVAKNDAITNVKGLWVAVIDRCDFGTAPRPLLLALDVTKSADRLKVIELSNGEGADLAERQYVVGRGVLPIRSDLGSAKINGRAVVLESSDRVEQWRISEDGSELIVSRLITALPARQQTLIFRRTQSIPENVSR